MVQHVFKFDRWDETDTLGFKPTWIPDADPGVGMTVAHDALEHCPGITDNPVADEMIAFGHMLHIRADYNWWANYANSWNTDPAENMAGDLAEMLSRMAWETQPDICPAPRPVRALRTEWAEDIIVKSLDLARKEFAENLTDDPDWRDDLHTATLLSRMGDWMRIGYGIARRRYQITSSARCDMFNAIEKKVDWLLKHNCYDLLEGISELRIQTFIKRAEVRFHICRDPEYSKEWELV